MKRKGYLTGNIVIFLLFVSITCFGQISGKVVSVSDGDTFTILTKENNQIKLRLHGIDCPEKSQPFGQVAKKFTSGMVYNKLVTANITDTDRYGRSIAIVILPDKTIVNEKLLSAGLAWHYTRYDNTKLYSALEKKAKEEKVGLWSDPNSIPPWAYRKQSKVIK